MLRHRIVYRIVALTPRMVLGRLQHPHQLQLQLVLFRQR